MATKSVLTMTTVKEEEPNMVNATNAAAPPTQEIPADMQTHIHLRAVQMAASGGRPDDVSLLRWALSRLPATPKAEQVRTAGLLIDEMHAFTDGEIRRFGGVPTAVPICYGPYTSEAPCVGDTGEVTIVHHPSAGWVVNGTLFTDRAQAERYAWKLTTLAKLARELGIEAR